MGYIAIEHHTAGIMTGKTTKLSPIYEENLTAAAEQVVDWFNAGNYRYDAFFNQGDWHGYIEELCYEAKEFSETDPTYDMRALYHQTDWGNEFILCDILSGWQKIMPINRIDFGDSYVTIEALAG